RIALEKGYMIATLTENGLKIATVEELLANLRGKVRENLLLSFRTTAGHLSRCLEISSEQLTIADLVDVTPSLKSYLEQRRYKRNSVVSYCKFATMLLAKAKQLGWRAGQPNIPEPWRPIVAAVTKS